jgi:hypothetical protein
MRSGTPCFSTILKVKPSKSPSCSNGFSPSRVLIHSAYFGASGLVGFLFGVAGGSVSVGRRFCHSGLTLRVSVFSPYVIMPCAARKWKNCASLSFSILVWFDNSSIWCHCPSTIIVNSFSVVKACLCTI